MDKNRREVCGYRAENDPVALAVLHFGCEVRRQVVLIDVPQQVTHRTQHHHLQTQRQEVRTYLFQQQPQRVSLCFTVKRGNIFQSFLLVQPTGIFNRKSSWLKRKPRSVLEDGLGVLLSRPVGRSTRIKCRFPGKEV